MENLITKYALLSRRTELRVHASMEVPVDMSEGRSLVCDPGTLIKVFQTQTSTSLSGNNKLSLVQVLDFLRQDPKYENLYECPQSDLCKVSEELWPYVISIADPERRLHLLQNRDQCRSIIYYKLNDLVSVTGDLFGKSSLRYDCITRYIGPVQELHPVGYFFALELLHLDSGHSLQAEAIPFSTKYMQCDPSLAIFTTADWISPLPTDVKKKFSALDLLSGTLEKVRTVIGPGGCTGKSPNSSFRKEKKERKQEATAQFYISSTSKNPLLSIDESDSKLKGTLTSTEMERKLQQITHVCETKSNPIISTESDEFKYSIENYENNLELQHASSGGIKNHVSAGILKHHRTLSASGGKDRASPKPLTIMSLEDRDIIVIDKADISESTRNESSVIVLDKSQHQDVDLADLLGSNWPSTAGDAASMLNKNLKQQPQEVDEQQQVVLGSGGSSNSNAYAQTRADRNKSPNPLSHLATPRQQDGVHVTQRNRVVAETSYSNVPNTTTSIGENAGEGVNANALSAEDCMHSSPLQEVLNNGLGVGSLVEISISEVPDELYGVIRWIGVPPDAKSAMVGVELEDDHTDKQLLTTDGSFNGVPLFKCNEGRALFVAPERCAFDKRFADMDDATGGKMHAYVRTDSKMFGQMDCPPVAGAVPPLKILNLEELEELCGKFKGIQGHHNSCYLDATLFSMFTFTPVFDSLLFRPPEPDDIPHYANVQKVLREEIVNPLRKNMFVRADRVMKLRQLLDKLSSVSGLMSEEKDPEEFLNSLLAQIMRVEPFLKLSSGQDAYFYQLFVEKDERLLFPTVQQLFEQSFHSSDIKLKEVPSCLIIQMPRFGKNYKMYPRILPSQVLDVTDIIDDSPRQCSVCGKLAEYECRDCFGILQGGVGLESTSFCRKCLETVHMHSKRANHTSKKLFVPPDFRIMAEHMTVPRLYMELFAVVCIETSHYVAFVKAGSGPDAPWCFFDSMADRKGEQNGYNIPEMITVPDLPQWLSEEGARSVNETSSNDKMLPEHAKRLFCDAYMCMYQSPDVMMYR